VKFIKEHLTETKTTPKLHLMSASVPKQESRSIACHMESQFYMPPDTGEHLNPSQTSLEGWKAELTLVLVNQ